MLTIRRVTKPTVPSAQIASSPRASDPGGHAKAGAVGDKLLTPHEAAERLRVTARVLERWRSTGEGPQFVRLSRKSIRYRDEDLTAFVAAGVRSNTVEQ